MRWSQLMEKELVDLLAAKYFVALRTMRPNRIIYEELAEKLAQRGYPSVSVTEIRTKMFSMQRRYVVECCAIKNGQPSKWPLYEKVNEMQLALKAHQAAEANLITNAMTQKEEPAAVPTPVTLTTGVEVMPTQNAPQMLEFETFDDLVVFDGGQTPAEISTTPLYDGGQTTIQLSNTPVYQMPSAPVYDAGQTPIQVSGTPVCHGGQTPIQVSGTPVFHSSQTPVQVSGTPVCHSGQTPIQISATPVYHGGQTPIQMQRISVYEGGQTSSLMPSTSVIEFSPTQYRPPKPRTGLVKRCTSIEQRSFIMMRKLYGFCREQQREQTKLRRELLEQQHSSNARLRQLIDIQTNLQDVLVKAVANNPGNQG